MFNIRIFVLCSFVFAGVLAACPLEAYSQDCKDEICVSSSSRWDPKRKDNIRYLHVGGFPTTKQGYVTQFHQVRGLPYPYPQQLEVWPNKYPLGIEFQGSLNVSVQACRRKGAVIIHTYCTSWVSFKVY